MVSLESYSSIVCFGASRGAILAYILEHYFEKILCIVDNDERKWGSKRELLVNGERRCVSIKSPDALRDFTADYEIIITAYNHIDEIGNQLDSMGYEGRWVSARRHVSEINTYEFRLYEKGIHPEKPVLRSLCLEVSSFCNCACIYCPFHGVQNLKGENKGLMDWEVIRSIAKNCKGISTIETVTASIDGEIFTHPEWYEMVQYILDNTGIGKAVLYTNGMLLNEKNIDKLLNICANEVELVVSIDGKSPEENDTYRVGDDYSSIKENIYRLAEKRDKARAALEIIITNSCMLTELEYGCSAQKEWPFSLPPPKFLRDDFPELAIISHRAFAYKSKYRDDTFGNLKYRKMSWPDEFFNRCTNLYTDISVSWNGDIQICTCGAACMEAPIGNVKNDDLQEVFIGNSRVNEYRRMIFEGYKPRMCDGCPYIGLGDYWVLIS